MKDDPLELMEPWRLLLLVAWVLVVLPLAAAVAAVIRWGGAQPPRVACSNCGYVMVVLERECPRCRARMARRS